MPSANHQPQISKTPPNPLNHPAPSLPPSHPNPRPIDLEFDHLETSQPTQTTPALPFDIDIDNIPESQANNDNDDELSSLVSYIDKSEKEQASCQRSVKSMHYDVLNKKRSELYDNCNFVGVFDQTCLGSICIEPESTVGFEGADYTGGGGMDWSGVYRGGFRQARSRFGKDAKGFRDRE